MGVTKTHKILKCQLISHLHATTVDSTAAVVSGYIRFISKCVQNALVKIRVENVPDVATCHWRGDEDGTGRQRGRPRALARATSSASGNGVRRRQSDIRSFDRLVSRDSGVGGVGARRVNVNYCKLCQQSCGSELRLFRIHEMTCPKRFEASVLESIKIHVSTQLLNHIWRGDQKSYRKMPKRV